MKRYRRHIVAAGIILFTIAILYITGIIEGMLTIILLLSLFPYASFSIFLYLVKLPRRKNAIDVYGITEKK